MKSDVIVTASRAVCSLEQSETCHVFIRLKCSLKNWEVTTWPRRRPAVRAAWPLKFEKVQKIKNGKDIVVTNGLPWLFLSGLVIPPSTLVSWGRGHHIG